MRARLLTTLALALISVRLGATSDPEPKDEPPQRRMVMIDPGHGGRDLGAVSNKVVEKELDLALSRLVEEEIGRSTGLAGGLTRGSDEFLALNARVEKAEQAGAAAFVSIHADKTSGRGREGVILFYFGKNRSIPKGQPRHYGEILLPPPPQAQVASSRRLARHIERALRAEGLKVGDMDRGAFAVLKAPAIPSVLLEVGNLRDKGEARMVSDPRFQRRLARAIARGLRSFFLEASSGSPSAKR